MTTDDGEKEDLVNVEPETPPRAHPGVFHMLLQRRRLWLVGIFIVASASMLGYQVLGKAKGLRGAAIAEHDDAGAQEVRIEIGMPTAAVNAALSAIAIDLADALVARYPGGEAPASGVFWELRDVNLVIRLYSEKGAITSIGYWSATGFGSEVERKARGMVVNTEKRSVLIDPELRDDSKGSTY